MGSQVGKLLLAVLATAFILGGCQSGNDPSLDKAAVAPTTGKPGEGPVEGKEHSANKPATAGAKAAEMPPGANRDHP